MKIYAVMFVAATLFTACSVDRQSGPSDLAVDQGGVADCPVTTRGYLPLPEGMVLDIPYHLRGDRIFANKKGAMRRRVTFEILAPGINDSLERVDEMMSAAGYEGSPRKEREDGAFGNSYKKARAATIRVVLKPGVGAKPANPDAKHLIFMEWQLKAAPKTPAKQSG